MWAYNTLTPYAFRCDLARYCLLYIYGGIYIDLGVRLINPWQIPITKEVAAFRDVPFITNSWTALQIGLLFSIPRQEEFKKAIDFIIENCRNKYYGKNPLYPTGPVVLGRAFIATMVAKGQSVVADNQHIGNCRCITPESPKLNMTYVSKEGTVVALRNKQAGGDLKHIGVSGSNNYNDIWRARQIYSEPTQIWDFKCHELQTIGVSRTSYGIFIPLNTKGRVIFGPYFKMNKGKYILEVYFSEETKFSKLCIDIACGNDHKTIKKLRYFNILKKNIKKLRFTFSTKRNYENIEFRLYVYKNFSGHFLKYNLIKIK